MILSLTSPLLRSAGFPHGFSLRTTADSAFYDAAAAGSVVRIAKQVHGARAILAGAEHDTRAEEADALVSATRGVAVCVRVADCVPVLVGSRATGAVAAIHAGWRGVEAGVIASAFELLRAADAVVAIGPCIGACCFEVGADVADRIARAAGTDAVVARREGDKAYVDLRLAVRAQLARLGIDASAVEDVPGCTKHEPERFYSYRRDGANAGRLLAVIGPNLP